MRRIWPLMLAGLLAACEHQASPKPNGVSPGVYPPGEDTCPATCATPVGTLQVPASDADIWAALVGVWQICSGVHSIFLSSPADTIGVEFAPAHTDLPYDAAPALGNLFFLTNGPSGPVRGGGFDYQQSYAVERGTVLYRKYPNYSADGFGAVYSPCPRQLKLEDGDHVALLAPF
jgi:hypothetical protein